MQLSSKYHFKLFNESIQTPTGKDSVPLGSGVITGLLGNGGMAQVYEIWNKELEVSRAVKLLHPNCNLEALQRFQTEIKITAKFHHPNIVEIHGIGEWNGLPYIEMEKADGLTLEELITKRGALPPTVGMAIGIMIARALEYAHNHEYVLYNKSYHGVIHRDLKPSNIMVSPIGGAKLMDFGIARPADASFHTVDGTILGTLQYLSPEQLEGTQLDIRTDLYSLGVCLYEMACGHIAFPESNITKLLSDKIKNKYKSLSEFDISIPEQYITLIHKLMHHDKKLRVQNAAVLTELLNTIYYQHTQDTPEQTVAQFMQTDIGTRISPAVFDRSPLRRFSNVLFIIISLMIVTISSLFFLAPKLFFHNKKSEATVKQILKYPQIPVITEDSLIINHDTTAKGSTIITHQKSQTSKEIETLRHLAGNLKEDKTRSEAAPKDPPQKSSTASLVDKLSSKYNTSNLLEIIEQELSATHYSIVLKLIDELTAIDARSTKALIFKLRALKKTNRSEFISFISTLKTQEAEILINRASVACDSKKTGDALIFLEKAEKAPAELLTYDQVNRELVFLKAVSITQLFDKSPDEAHWKASIGAWYQVKKILRTDQNNSYYVTADKEIARIGEKYRSQTK